MNILLIFVVICYNVNFITCFDEYSGSSTATTITVSSQYKCNSGFALRSVESAYSYTYDEVLSCNDINFETDNLIFNLTLGYKVVPLTVYNLRAIVNRSKGDIVFTGYGAFNDPVCEEGKIYLFNTYKNRDRQICSSKRGLTYLETDYAILRILGGRCEGTCSGKLRVSYSPGLRN